MKKIWLFVMCICFSSSFAWSQVSGNGYFAPNFRGKFVYPKNGILTYDPQDATTILGFITGGSAGFNTLAHYPQNKMREDLIRRFSLRFGRPMSATDISAVWSELKVKHVMQSYWNNPDEQGFRKASAYITPQGTTGFQFPTRETFILYHPVHGDILDLYCGNPIVEINDPALTTNADEPRSNATVIYVTTPAAPVVQKQDNDLVLLLLKEMREDRAVLLKLFEQRSAPPPASNNDELVKLLMLLKVMQGGAQPEMVRYAPQEFVVAAQPRQNRFWDAFEGLTAAGAQYGIFSLLFRGNNFGGFPQQIGFPQQFGFPQAINYGNQQFIGSPWGTNINSFAPQPVQWIDQPIAPRLGGGGVIRPPYNTTPIGGSPPYGGGYYNTTPIGGSNPGYGYGGSYNPPIGGGGFTGGRNWNYSNIGG